MFVFNATIGDKSFGFQGKYYS